MWTWHGGRLQQSQAVRQLRARAWLESRPRLGLSPSIHNTEIHITHSEPPSLWHMTTTIWSINHNKMTNRQMEDDWQESKREFERKSWNLLAVKFLAFPFPIWSLTFSGITNSLHMEFGLRHSNIGIQMIKSPCQLLWLKPPLLQSAPLLGCNPDLDWRIRIFLKKVHSCSRRRRKKISIYTWSNQYFIFLRPAR